MTDNPRPTILRGDARSLPLTDNTVDLVVTSPPYFGLRSYQDGGEHYDGQIGDEPTPGEYVDSLITCTREMVRVLKPSGSIFVNLGDKYAAAGGHTSPGIARSSLLNAMGRKHEDQRVGHARHYGGSTKVPPGFRVKSLMLIPERYRIRCVDDLGLIARAVVIWDKPNGLPESVTDRVRRSHEDWVHLTIQPRYFSAVDDIRTPASGYARASANRPTPSGQRPRAMADTCNPLGRLPGSVWEIPTQPLKVPPALGVDHFAAFPMEWPRRIIRAWSPLGGVVLDPFGGTGTTALVAAMLGRVGISVDASADYCRLAEWRVSDPKERARAADADPSKVVPVAVGQTSFFDLEAS